MLPRQCVVIVPQTYRDSYCYYTKALVACVQFPMQVDYSFIYTDWYQKFFSEPAPFRWLWRWLNTYMSEEEYAKLPPERADEMLLQRFMCVFDEVSYRRRKRTMRSKQKYDTKFQNNKEKLREALLERDGANCMLCKRPLNGDFSLDHIDTTMDENGALNSDVSNLQLTHARCNSWRGVKQNRPQNKMWQKARRAIGSMHQVDHRMLGYADRVDKMKKKFGNKKKETPEEYRRRQARKPRISPSKE